MEIISKANHKVMAILGKPVCSGDRCRLIKYCIPAKVDEGVLLFHILTRELVLLSDEEYANILELEELKDRWFVVPEQMDEMKKADMVRWILRSTAKKPKNTNNYIVMTTTDCNARCFYCFEKGRSRIPMSEETAHKTARYIREHCGGQKVRIAWFGGEPLFNQKAMDIISQDLREAGVDFHSGIATNGYLFDDEAVYKAKNLWNLKTVQITLDGTEEVYNRSKAFIYRDGKSPYQVVMESIGRLLEAGLATSIRLNLDLYNAENLMLLVDELAARFGGKQGFSIYAHHLFDGEIAIGDYHTDEEWGLRFEAMHRLNSKIEGYGLRRIKGIRKHLKTVQCMVDHGGSLVIAPTGDIGLCEHYSDSRFVGHLDQEKLDPEAVKAWRELSPPIPACAECIWYPDCIRLKNCTLASVCFRHELEEELRSTKESMVQEFKLWKEKAQKEDCEDEILC